MTTEEFLNSSEAIILVDSDGYEITETTKKFAYYQASVKAFLKKEHRKSKKFWKFIIFRKEIESTIADIYLMDLIDGRKELINYPINQDEEYKLPFHFRVAHTFTWNPDAQKLLDLFQKYPPFKNCIDNEMLDEMKIFMGVKKRIEAKNYLFQEVMKP